VRRYVSFIPLIAAIGLVVASLATASRIPLFDPDEGFYPATAAESVASGDWWDLRFNGEARWDKPVLAYALIEGSFALFGKGAVAARLPSALEAAALVLLLSAILSKLAGARAGACAAVVLTSSLGLQIFGRAAHPEIAVVLSIGVTEMLLIWWLVSSPDEKPAGLSVLIGLSLGYGLLAKGPVAVVVPLIGALCAAPFVTSLRHRWTEAIGDAAVAGAVGITIAAPWYVAMTWRHGMTFLATSVWAQNVGRYTGGIRHGQSALMFAAATLVGLMPWTGVLPAALAGIRRPRGDRRRAVRFTAAVMALASLLFYASSASKLASYSLALLPPLAVVIGLYLDQLLYVNRPIDASRRQVSLAFVSTAVVLMAMAVALFALPSMPTLLRTRDVIGGVPAAEAGSAFTSTGLWVGAVLLIGAALVFFLPNRGRIAALYGVGIAAPLVALIALGPILDDAYPWRRFGQEIARAPASAWIQNYRASSLTFWAGQPITRVSGDEELEALLASTGKGWVILGADWAEKPVLADRILAGRATVQDRTARLALVQLK